jgi:hypothetical protein
VLNVLPLAADLRETLSLASVNPNRGVPRWHARLCSERQLSAGGAQLALAALNALPGAGAESAAHALASILRVHGLGREASVVEDWTAERS